LKNMLVVDDTETLLYAVAEWLGICFADWGILTAGNGKEAIEILESVQVDFMLTDLQMPVMDGYDLLAYIRENHPHIPTVAMSGSYDREAKERLHALGVPRCLEKPVSFKIVGDTIVEELTLGAKCTEEIHNKKRGYQKSWNLLSEGYLT
jgi:CheY-like chemotaxis protein